MNEPTRSSSHLLQTMAFLCAFLLLAGVYATANILRAGQRAETRRIQTATAAPYATETARAREMANRTATHNAGQTVAQIERETRIAKVRQTITAMAQSDPAKQTAARLATLQVHQTATARVSNTTEPPAGGPTPSTTHYYTETCSLSLASTIPPTTQQVLQFVQDCHHVGIGRSPHDGNWLSAVTDVARQDVDVDGDGVTEILLAARFYYELAGVTILDRVDGSWYERLFLYKVGKNYANARVSIQNDLQGNRILVDLYGTYSGTANLNIIWNQLWVRCQGRSCSIIWAATVMENNWALGMMSFPVDWHAYSVGEIEGGYETITLTTHRVALLDAAPGPRTDGLCRSGNSICTATPFRRAGPDTVETYRWDGKEFRFESTKYLSPEMTVRRETDPMRDETDARFDRYLESHYIQPDGTRDETGFQASRAQFWRLDGPSWGPPTRTLDAAAHTVNELGDMEWVAGMVGANDSPACRLSVYHRWGREFAPAGRAEEECTANLSRLAWADVTGDGQEELLWLTYPPREEVGSDVQSVRIYAVGEELVEIAYLEGFFNGEDGAGIRWQDMDGDGAVELFAGLPVEDRRGEEFVWPEMERRFQVYHWDAAAGALAPGIVVTAPYVEADSPPADDPLAGLFPLPRLTCLLFFTLSPYQFPTSAWRPETGCCPPLSCASPLTAVSQNAAISMTKTTGTNSSGLLMPKK